MNFLELAKQRQSDRAYSSKPVEKSKIERCIEAASYSPSACNSQPWHFIVVDNPELKNLVAEKLYDTVMAGNKFVRSAPVIVAVIEEKPNITSSLGGMIKGKQFTFLDIGMAVENFCLQAADEGLGTCILGWFDEKGVSKLLGVPRSKRIPLAITIGYPVSDKIRPKKRKSLEQILTYNHY